MLQVNCEKGEGKTLAQKYNIKGYPTFYLVNAQQEPLYVFMGYGKEYFIETMNTAFSDLTPIAEKMKRFEQNPDPQTAKLLAEFYYAKDDLQKALKCAKKALELSPQKDIGLKKQIFSYAYWGYRNQQIPLDTLKAVVATFLKDSLDNQTRARFLFYTASVLQQKPDDKELIGFLKELIQLIHAHPDILNEKNRQEAQVLHCLYVEKDLPKALALKKKSLPEGWQNDPNKLNQFAWWCFENKINLDEAEQLARKGVQLAEDDEFKVYVMDTLAEILSLKGKHQEAIKIEEQALKLAPDKDFLKQNLEKFKKRAQQS